jgi:hypothetical protein
MVNVHQLRELIIKPALEDLQMLSDDAVELLVFTCAVETMGGSFLKQINGPALGIYQMEPDTYHDIWQNYLIGKSSLYMRLHTNFDVSRIPDEYRLIYDLRFATAMARIHYARVPEVLPQKQDVCALFDYYKKYYNTNQGAAQPTLSIAKYQTYINN